jgi:hypothetical protein
MFRYAVYTCATVKREATGENGLKSADATASFGNSEVPIHEII